MEPAQRKQLLLLAKSHFGYEDWRPGQLEALEAALLGRDSLLLMATGSGECFLLERCAASDPDPPSTGKSLCYQLLPLATRLPSIVISPLISLMQDQVAGLTACGVKACFLGSAQLDKAVESGVVLNIVPVCVTRVNRYLLLRCGSRSVPSGLPLP